MRHKPDPTVFQPDLSKKPTGNHLARIALDFEVHLRTSDVEDYLRGDPPSNFYWIVRLGRLTLRRDGGWDYAANARRYQANKDFEALRAHFFVSFEEAVRVATSVFGLEPEGAAGMRGFAMDVERKSSVDVLLEQKQENPDV